MTVRPAVGSLEHDALLLEKRQLDDEINAAYWRFCRCANAKPPILVVPKAYARRREVEILLGFRRPDCDPTGS